MTLRSTREALWRTAQGAWVIAYALALTSCSSTAAAEPYVHDTAGDEASDITEVAPTPTSASAVNGSESSALAVPLSVTDGSDEDEPPILPPVVPLLVQQPIEDASGHALSAFYEALRRADAGQGQARIVYYGASHVASDLYTDVLRRTLQARFGDAGAGFFLPAKPYRWYRNSAIEYERATGIRGIHVKARAQLHERYGLAGVYLRAGDKPGRGAFTLKRGTADVLELFYLKQPGGGHLHVRIDDEEHVISTRSAKPKSGYARFDVKDAPHRVELIVKGNGPVRIFGMSAERSGPGVIIDTLGIPGARARYHLLWDDALYREHLAQRRPDLVVLAYGTNEAGDDDVPIAFYERELRKVIARVRAAVPASSILLVGPSDRPLKLPDGTYADRPRTAEIVTAQRKVAAEMGCAFFDVVAFMGGPLGMLRWVSNVPPYGTPDHVHFTRSGYEAMGAVLTSALLQGFGAGLVADPTHPAPTTVPAVAPTLAPTDPPDVAPRDPSNDVTAAPSSPRSP